MRGLLNHGHLNTVLSLGTVSSKLLDIEMRLCSSVIPMALLTSLSDITNVLPSSCLA